MLEYKNYSDIIRSNETITFKENHPLLPKHPFRMLLCGSSHSGKTNTLICMLMDFLDYDRLYIISPSLNDQKVYQHILQLSERNPDTIMCYERIEDFDLSLVDNTKTNIIIFDDCVTEKKQHHIIESAFCYGRHKKSSILFLSQSYFDVPKLIRTNISQFCLFKLGQSNEIDYIRSRVAGEISASNFRKMYNQCMKIPYAFLYIDTLSPPESKYRLRFDKFLKVA